MPPPTHPKIYHILHVDRVGSVASDDHLFADSIVLQRRPPGTTIGMSSIKTRRLGLPLTSHNGLRVGDCVPFYFCSRSVMLFLLHRANHEELEYRGGQDPIIHLEADLMETVRWAEANQKRWAFTLSNAGANYFEDRCDLNQLGEVNWDAVVAQKWSGSGVSRSLKEGKQAEFLVEESFPWTLVERIGVNSQSVAQQVSDAMIGHRHRPPVEIKRSWYY